MLDNFIYETHLGKKFVGLNNRVYLNTNDMRNYEWSYETINNRISRFYKGIKARKIPLIVYCSSDEEAVKIKNLLCDMAETDIQAKLPGKVYIGDYYTYGFITSSIKSNYLITKRLCYIELTFTSDNPSWYREQKHTFLPNTGGVIGVGGGTDYPYDYPYDYALSLKGRSVVCDSAGSSAFKLLIYGEAVNPAVVIDGHIYSVIGSIGKGETLEIDSLNKTVTLTTAMGNKVNWFDKRGRESYIFEPIPSGQNTVSWLGTFGFDLTVIEERSEPRWT